MKKKLHIVEGWAGVWYYHLSETGDSGKLSLCGNHHVMRTNIPLRNWGLVGHLNERYCAECEAIAKQSFLLVSE